MVDINFVGQLVEAMAEAVSKLEVAMAGDEHGINNGYVNQLRIFIIDVHNKLEEALSQIG
tara:strand:+ start:453 stop:632 length:180 start_codon:yes stop_codon:yes gene_type:complete